jgi:hypothetical protein
MIFTDEDGKLMEEAAVAALFNILKPVYFPECSSVEELTEESKKLISNGITATILAYGEVRNNIVYRKLVTGKYSIE